MLKQNDQVEFASVQLLHMMCIYHYGDHIISRYKFYPNL